MLLRAGHTPQGHRFAMAVEIVVCVKQVIDPETPASAFSVDRDARRAVPAPGIPPIVNGFDENAVEAALRIKDTVEASVTVVSVGNNFVMDVMKKPLSMGAGELVLAEGPDLEELDSFATAYALSKVIKRRGDFDLILCGRQASDWDNAQVPLALAELLGLPCITVARRVEVVEGGVVVERALLDGYEVVETELPAVVTVSNELGEPRYPTLRGIMAASRKAPTVWTASDLGLDAGLLEPRVCLVDVSIPASEKRCEFIEGDDDADAGRHLALRLREDKLI